MYSVFDEYQALIWRDGTIDTIGTHSQIFGRMCELENYGFVLNKDFYITSYLD